MPEQHRRNPNTKCFTCSKPIYKRPFEIENNKGRVFCGLPCYGIASRKEKPCAVCKKPIMSSLNKITCSRSCSNVNRAGLKYKGGRPRDKVVSQRALKLRLLKIRGKKCERCNYVKYEILQVHHKDENRNNNDLSNLELICPNCHYEKHYLEESWLKKYKFGEVG